MAYHNSLNISSFPIYDHVVSMPALAPRLHLYIDIIDTPLLNCQVIHGIYTLAVFRGRPVVDSHPHTSRRPRLRFARADPALCKHSVTFSLPRSRTNTMKAICYSGVCTQLCSMYSRSPLLDTASGKPFFSRIWISHASFHSLPLRDIVAVVRDRTTYEVVAYLREVGTFTYSLSRFARVAELDTVDAA